MCVQGHSMSPHTRCACRDGRGRVQMTVETNSLARATYRVHHAACQKRQATTRDSKRRREARYVDASDAMNGSKEKPKRAEGVGRGRTRREKDSGEAHHGGTWTRRRRDAVGVAGLSHHHVRRAQGHHTQTARPPPFRRRPSCEMRGTRASRGRGLAVIPEMRGWGSVGTLSVAAKRVPR